MRFKLCFDLENEIFPIQYRKNILSFIKGSLSDYSNEEFKKLYNEKDPIIKPYTFSVFFNNPKFNKEYIILEDKKFEITFSIQDYGIAINLYNAFNNQRRKEFSINKNSWTLISIFIMPEKKITSSTAIIKFMSPLVVRNRNQETRKDYYYSYKNEKFNETLKINIKEQIKDTDFSLSMLESFSLEPIQASRTVVKFYEKQIECSLGIYKLSADKRLIEFLYKAGLGSKHSCGFGMFQII